MGRADTATKDLMSRNDVFADVINYAIYNGETMIKPEHLDSVDTTQVSLPYGSDNAAIPVQKSRDVVKTIVKSSEKAVYAIIGIENQTDIHYAMPVRNMFYDVMSYEAQIKAAYRSYEKEKDVKFTHEEFLSKWKQTDKLVPVITLVVNFSSDKWNAPKSLHEMIDFKDEAMKRFVPDYSIPVVDFASMTDEEINKFQTTIREVAECARYVTSPEILMERIRKNDRYKGLDVTTAYVIENVLKTNINTEDYEAKEEVNMCKQMEEYLEGIKESGVEQGLQRGIQQGVQQGMHQGVQQGMSKVVEQMRKSGMSEEQINEILSIDV